MKKWIILILAAVTSMVAYAMPLLSLPPLFTEIAADLDLSLTQVGLVWGAAGFASVLTSIPLGAVGDRLGPRRTLSTACFLVAIFGALRGLSFNYASFMITVLLHGLITPAIPPNLHKTVGAWFPQQKGLASGVLATGFGIGLSLGAALSASVLSPWLGGWQPVLFLYGAGAAVMGVLWLVIYPVEVRPKQSTHISLIDSLRIVTQSRGLWVIGSATLCLWACYRGFSGYLPIYLKNSGWDPALADQALALFFVGSLIGVLPTSIISDRLSSRRGLMFLCIATIGVSVTLFSFAQGILFWIAIVAGGFFFDAYMAVHQAAVQEVPGMTYAYTGVALGFTATLRELGGAFSPPIGNALAEIYGPTTPFIFWGAMGILGAFIIWFLPTSPQPEVVVKN